ncbi:PREDICTED: uncharacterized protein LOC107107313 [Gekko japonicus]|uniref:Uncharacterized protein LOC107107313 n=1 Tax=Gekko japonicus TaxID=146911 RepID=A0ABM1JNP3_GEKJA|nr:PREDICTED: uncharacterized protein LOC107107313 [Gekko japonicus]
MQARERAARTKDREGGGLGSKIKTKQNQGNMDASEGNSTTGSVKKRKYYCYFKDEWCKEEAFKGWLHKVDMVTAECILCHQGFSIKYEGRGAVTSHADSSKHKELEKQRKQMPEILTFFNKPNFSQEDMVTAAEVGQVYHSIVHHLSYASQACAYKTLSRILPDSVVARKMSCGRTKATSIAESVLAPKSRELLLKDLEVAPFFSIASDASNKRNKKFFPVTVRYFSVTEGIKHGLLDFYNELTSDSIATRIAIILQENGLSVSRVASYMIDNASVDFAKHWAVFQDLKQLNDGLLQVGCIGRIIHNCLKKGMRALSFDVETLIFKIYSEFSSSPKKTESLTSFFEFVETDYKDVLQHVSTGWLALLPAIDRVLENWSVLRAYFLSEGDEECVKIVWEAFNAEEHESLPLCYVHFVHNLMRIFSDAVKKMECDHVGSTELHGVLEGLHCKLKRRREDKFYGRSAQVILGNVSVFDNQKFTEEAENMLTQCIAFLEECYSFKGAVFEPMAVLSLNNEVKWSDLVALVAALRIEIDIDQLYNEYCVLQKFREEIVSKEQKIDQRWVKVFRHIPERADSQLLKLVSFVLSIPVSNTFCEKIYSLMAQLWSKDRNRLSDSVVKAELQVQLNFNISCADFHEFLYRNPELLRAARGQQKYRFKKEEPEGAAFPLAIQF